MTLFAKTFELSDIQETVFPRLERELEFEITNDEFYNDTTNFCIDNKGRVRLGRGLISYDPESDEDMKYVPRSSYSIAANPWNSHDVYFLIELPNPAQDFEHYNMIRNAFLTELQRRIDRHKKNAQARIRRQKNKS